MLKTSLLSGLMQHMNQPCWSVLMSSCPLTSPFIKKSKVCLGIGCPELYHSQNYYVNCSCLQNCSVITTSNLGARIISCVFFFFFPPKDFNVMLFAGLLKVTSPFLHHLSICNACERKMSSYFIQKNSGPNWKKYWKVQDLPGQYIIAAMLLSLWASGCSTVLKITIRRTHPPTWLLTQNVLLTVLSQTLLFIFSVVKDQPACSLYIGKGYMVLKGKTFIPCAYKTLPP